MSKSETEHGARSQLAGILGVLSVPGRWIARRSPFSRKSLSIRQRSGYAVVSFLLGVTYLRILLIVGFELSAGTVLSLMLGVMCFAVCIFNLVFIGLERG